MPPHFSTVTTNIYIYVLRFGLQANKSLQILKGGNLALWLVLLTFNGVVYMYLLFPNQNHLNKKMIPPLAGDIRAF